MTKFRKKPDEIDAVQFNADGDHPSVFKDGESQTGFFFVPGDLGPLSGDKRLWKEVAVGDWIVTEPSGKTHVVGGDVFPKTYEQI